MLSECTKMDSYLCSHNIILNSKITIFYMLFIDGILNDCGSVFFSHLFILI